MALKCHQRFEQAVALGHVGVEGGFPRQEALNQGRHVEIRLRKADLSSEVQTSWRGGGGDSGVGCEEKGRRQPDPPRPLFRSFLPGAWDPPSSASLLAASAPHPYLCPWEDQLQCGNRDRVATSLPEALKPAGLLSSVPSAPRHPCPSVGVLINQHPVSFHKRLAFKIKTVM